MIKFKTTPETQLQLAVSPKTAALQIALATDDEIAEFIKEFTLLIVERKTRGNPTGYQQRIAQYIAMYSKPEEMDNIESFFGTMTDAIGYQTRYYIPQFWRDKNG